MKASNEIRNATVQVPTATFRHVKAKNGKDWYVQEVGLIAEDGLSDRFEVWHAKQADLLPVGKYFALADGAYVKDGRLNLRTAFVPVKA